MNHLYNAFILSVIFLLVVSVSELHCPHIHKMIVYSLL